MKGLHVILTTAAITLLACGARSGPSVSASEGAGAVRIATRAPTKTEVRFPVPMTAATYRRLDAAARAQGRSTATYLRGLILAETERAEIAARIAGLAPGAPVVVETILTKEENARLRALVDREGGSFDALVGRWIDSVAP
ncbi:MAG: hypothetical protein KC466_21420 [Myxococcales bacterium]|nr:hypothetical protein [Myxococcales bacterium]